jgi:hypothetical protein
MNKSLVIFSFWGILFLFNSPGYPGEAYCVFDSIEYPKTIFIQKQSERNLKMSCFIKYRYYGESLVSNDNKVGHFSSKLYYFPKGKIYYFTKDKRILPEALKFFLECGLTSCSVIGKDISGYDVYPLLINKDLESIEIDIFSPFIFEKTDIDEAINAKKLNQIVIIIDEIEIEWKLTDQMDKEQPRVREGSYMMKVNKTIKIKVKYEKKAAK